MSIRIFVVILVLFFFITPQTVLSQSACCAANGGAYACDYSTSTLYCRDGTVSRECSCKQVTPTSTPSPTPTSVPSLPACVANSSYDAGINACKCNNGYIVKDNACITYRDFCWSNYGGNSNYDTNKNSCTCISGYGLNSSGTSCISYDEICRNAVGDKSSYNRENNSCVCFSGYSIQDNKCRPIPSPALSPQVHQIDISQIPSPVPTDKPETPKSKIIPPNKTITQENEPTLTVRDGGNFVTEKKPEENIIKKFFSALRNFISRIF